MSAEDILGREGRWDIRVTVYRNGRRVGTCDTADWDTFDQAAYWVGEGLSTRDVELHEPTRRKPTPTPAAPSRRAEVNGDQL